MKQNPLMPTPPEILRTIAQIPVRYVDMIGSERVGSIEMHEDTLADVRAFFDLAHKIGFPIAEIAKSSDERFRWNDDVLMAENVTSGFNYRPIKGTDTPSLHGLGRAFDVNPVCNPYFRSAESGIEIDPPGASYDPNAPGALHAEHPLVFFMKSRGWHWGGDWPIESGRTDYQHFEKPPQKTSA